MGGSSGEYADSTQRVESAEGEQQVRQWWTNEHCPHIHGAERPVVIDKDHRAGRRAVLSTRKCAATQVWARGAVEMWSMRRGRRFGRGRMVGVPLDVCVGREVGDSRNACIPQTNVILARAGFSLVGDEWESGARVVSLARGRIAGQRNDSGARQRGRTGSRGVRACQSVRHAHLSLPACGQLEEICC